MKYTTCTYSDIHKVNIARNYGFKIVNLYAQDILQDFEDSYIDQDTQMDIVKLLCKKEFYI